MQFVIVQLFIWTSLCHQSVQDTSSPMDRGRALLDWIILGSHQSIRHTFHGNIAHRGFARHYLISEASTEFTRFHAEKVQIHYLSKGPFLNLLVFEVKSSYVSDISLL
jgi:hypothetical protein